MDQGDTEEGSDYVLTGGFMEATQIVSEKDGYKLEFNPKTHRYFLHIPGEPKRRPLVSVTTTNRGYPVAEGLIKWRIGQGIEEYISGQKLGKASAIGTFSHELFYKIEKGEPVDVPEVAEIQNIIELHKVWWDKVGYKDEVTHRENIMAHPDYMLAGTLDRSCIRDGKRWLQDYKTAKGIYIEAFFQLAWYDILAEFWLGIKHDVWEVIRFGKEDSEYETQKIEDPDMMKEYKAQALRNLATYRFTSKYNT